MQNRPMYPETVAPPVGLYAHAVEIAAGSRILVLAGQVGLDAAGNIPPDFRTQAENTWLNCTRILEYNGLRMKDVVKITHFLTDARNIPVYNEVRARFLGNERPASTLLLVAGLFKPEFLVEVEMMAAMARDR